MTDPCFYGIDFASKAELVASGLTVDEIRASIGSDSLAFVSLDGLTEASTRPAEALCRACFTGDYPIPLPHQDLIGKHVLEGITRTVTGEPSPDHEHTPDGTTVTHNGLSPADPLDDFLQDTLVPGVGAEDAVRRP